MKVRPSVVSQNTRESYQDASTKECLHQETVTLELTKEFQEVLDKLIKQAKPYWNRLQESGMIPPTKLMSTLNQDYTRFLLKQAELSLRGRKGSKEETQKYCNTICLHAMVSTANILMQSGLVPAIGRCEDKRDRIDYQVGKILEPPKTLSVY